MRRRTVAAQAISPLPTVTASRTSPARVESIPFRSASVVRTEIGAAPTARRARLPAAQRTTNPAEIRRRIFQLLGFRAIIETRTFSEKKKDGNCIE